MTEDEEEKCANMIYLALGIGFLLGCITIGVAQL